MPCLDGLVVLDLARRYPAAFIPMMLGDFGAEVIKVDPPDAAPIVPLDGLSEEQYAAWYAMDRNKRSVVLDLKKESAREIFLRLAAKADVVVESFRPGVADRLGIGYDRLHQINPRLVYCSVSGFGQSGPYRDIPAHDMNYIGIAGALSLIGERDGQPYLPSNLVGDFGGAAMHGLVGTLLALMARERTGKGQFVDVAFLDSVISLVSLNATEYFATGKAPKRGENGSNGGAVWAQVFRCQDGEYFTIGAAEPHLWANLCNALGRPDLIAEQNAPRERGDQIVKELAAIFATRTRDEWYAYLRDKQACVAPVYNLDETFNDPQVIHREMVVELEHPAFGKIRQTGIPIKLSDTPGEIRRLGVPTGADTTAVLAELGYGATEIARFKESGALGKG